MAWWNPWSQRKQDAEPAGSSLKWFFALNEASPGFQRYADLIQVAVYSARQHTNLQPHFLYDGRPNQLTAWLEDQGVRVIPCRTFLHSHIERKSREQNRPQTLSIGAGAFLRLEIPTLTERLGLDDTYVLYTDCDVMFTGEVEPTLRRLRPRYFAVAPEGLDRRNRDAMNSGVMLMNLPALRSVDGAFKNFILANLDDISLHYDQRAYKRYFGKESNGRTLWDELPAEYNWKPYWGVRDTARIVHFHAAKPTDRTMLRAGKGGAALQRLATGGFDTYCDRWEAALHAARAAS